MTEDTKPFHDPRLDLTLSDMQKFYNPPWKFNPIPPKLVFEDLAKMNDRKQE